MTDSIIVDTATRIFADLCTPDAINAAEKGTWPGALWAALEESGLTVTWVPDTLGGAGADIIDGFQVLRATGRAAAAVPLAETLLAGWLLAEAKIAVPAGPLTIAPVYEDGHIELDGTTLRGRARHIPYARNAQHIAVLAYQEAAPVVALVATDGLFITEGTSLAGEPRDTVSFDGATVAAVAPAPALQLLDLVHIGA